MQDRYVGIFKCSISSKVCTFISCDAFLRRQKWQHAFVFGNLLVLFILLDNHLYLYKSKCLQVYYCLHILSVSSPYVILKIFIMNAII